MIDVIAYIILGIFMAIVGAFVIAGAVLLLVLLAAPFIALAALLMGEK